jgi:restriction system protein
LLSDGREWSTDELRRELAQRLELSNEELQELAGNSGQTAWVNRTSWALVRLGQSGAILKTRPKHYRITDVGHAMLHQPGTAAAPPAPRSETERATPPAVSGRLEPYVSSAARIERAPLDRMLQADRELQSALTRELLQRIKEQSPTFFEGLVLDLLQAMGYGGSREDAANRLGQSGDGGVDGVIREDPLGLDLIYVQAKRWSNTVGRPDIQQFVGALTGKRAAKGVFITTSSFSTEARGYVDTLEQRVVLVDGDDLARLMVQHDVGVSVEHEFFAKKIDLDYFGVEELAPSDELDPR